MSYERRTLAAKLLLSIVQRDHEVRIRLIEDDGLHIILELLREGLPSKKLLEFFMGMVLSTLVLDDAAMEALQQRNECYTLFQCCLAHLKGILAELGGSDLSPPGEVSESVERDGKLPVRLAEGCAQALWGSSYYCALSEKEIVTKEEIADLAILVQQSAATRKARYMVFAVSFLSVFRSL